MRNANKKTFFFILFSMTEYLRLLSQRYKRAKGTHDEITARP